MPKHYLFVIDISFRQTNSIDSKLIRTRHIRAIGLEYEEAAIVIARKIENDHIKQFGKLFGFKIHTKLYGLTEPVWGYEDGQWNLDDILSIKADSCQISWEV